MDELTVAQHFVLYVALIIAVVTTLDWIETRWTRPRVPSQRHHERPGQGRPRH